MRHGIKTKVLGREKRQRTALARSIARAVIMTGAITTTEAKAKATRSFIERLITIAKTDSVANRRLALSRTGNDAQVLARLYKDLAPKYKDRAGGYTRITKLPKMGKRTTTEVRLELV